MRRDAGRVSERGGRLAALVKAAVAVDEVGAPIDERRGGGDVETMDGPTQLHADADRERHDADADRTDERERHHQQRRPK